MTWAEEDGRFSPAGWLAGQHCHCLGGDQAQAERAGGGHTLSSGGRPRPPARLAELSPGPEADTAHSHPSAPTTPTLNLNPRTVHSEAGAVRPVHVVTVTRSSSGTPGLTTRPTAHAGLLPWPFYVPEEPAAHWYRYPHQVGKATHPKRVLPARLESGLQEGANAN